MVVQLYCDNLELKLQASRDAPILLFFFHLFFVPAILFFLTYFAQYFARKVPILLTFFQTQKRK